MEKWQKTERKNKKSKTLENVRGCSYASDCSYSDCTSAWSFRTHHRNSTIFKEPLYIFVDSASLFFDRATFREGLLLLESLGLTWLLLQENGSRSCSRVRALWCEQHVRLSSGSRQTWSWNLSRAHCLMSSFPRVATDAWLCALAFAWDGQLCAVLDPGSTQHVPEPSAAHRM